MTLLIIDDDAINNCTHTRVAETSGLFKETRCLKNGREAMHFLGEVCKGAFTLPDLILINPHMPDISVIDFIRKLPIETGSHGKQTGIMIVPKHDLDEVMDPGRWRDLEHLIMSIPGLRYIGHGIFSLSNLAIIRATTILTVCSANIPD